MHVQILQVQLTYTASDPREIKLIHFSKVRRKLSYLSIKGKQILSFWSLHPLPSAPSSNIGQKQLISAMLHKHSKFTNKSISSYKRQQTTKINTEPE